LSANLSKFTHGGWFALLIASFYLPNDVYLLSWKKNYARKHIEFVEIKDYLDDLQDLQNDTSIPKEATNLVFMCNANDKKTYRLQYYLFHFSERNLSAQIRTGLCM
jgi:KUP system potassium uptake protein